MYLAASLLLYGAMIALPLMFQINVAEPPVNITGWLVFAISLAGFLGGFLSLVTWLLTKLVINPAIQLQLAAIPTRTEFQDHVDSDDKFQIDVRSFIERHDAEGHEDRRHDSRRRGDPR